MDVAGVSRRPREARRFAMARQDWEPYTFPTTYKHIEGSPMKPHLAIVFTTLVTAGCASSSGVKPVKRTNPFPKQEQFAAIQKAAPPSQVFTKQNEVQVAVWKLTGPLPERIESKARAPQSEWEKSAASELGPDDRLSESMQCVARETGIFFLEYGALPHEQLRDFIRMRCGSVAPTYASNWIVWDRRVDEADALSEQRGYPAEAAQRVAASDNASFGVWYGASDERTVVMTTFGRRTVEVEPTPFSTAATGTFDVRGRLLTPGARLGALVNDGEYDFRHCESMPGPPLPEFHVRCTANPEDRAATFSVSVAQEGAVHSRAVLLQQAWPAKAPGDTFYARGEEPIEPVAAEAAPSPETAGDAGVEANEENPEGAPTPDVEPELARALPVEYSPARSAEEVERRMLQALNEVRQVAGRPPVKLSAAQTVAANNVADNFFAASFGGGDHAVLNEITMGLLAGWDVDGPIMDGDFVAQYNFSGDPDELLDALLSRPGGRKALLDAKTDVIAIGSHIAPDSSALGVLVNSYDFVEDTIHKARVDALIATLNSQRAAFGSKPAKVHAASRATAANHAAEVDAGESTLHHAAGKVLRTYQQQEAGKAATYYLFETGELAEVEFPDDLIRRDPLELGVMVTVYKPDGFPWYVHGVLLVFEAKKPATRVASASKNNSYGVEVSR